MRIPVYILRLMMLGAAVLIWANLTAYRQTTRTVDLPIRIAGLTSEKAIAALPPTLTVRIAGTNRALNQINDRTLIFTADLSAAQIGQTITAAVAPSLQPKGVQILGFEPSKITIPIEQSTQTTVPVIVESTGSLADGYKLTSLVASPDQVTVTGSQALISTIGHVIAKIDVTNKRSTFSIPANLSLDTINSMYLSALPVAPSSVTATAEIQPGNSSRSLGIKPTFSGQIPDGYFIREVKFDPPLVTLVGNDRSLRAIGTLFSTPIQLTDRRQSFSDNVSAVLPRSIKVDGENLLRVTVDIERSEASKEFVVAPQFVNVGADLTVKSVTPKTIQVVLVGQPAALQQLTRSQVELNVDLAGVLSGGTKIPITASMFQLPSGVSVGSFTPGEIEVILSRG